MENPTVQGEEWHLFLKNLLKEMELQNACGVKVRLLNGELKTQEYRSLYGLTSDQVNLLPPLNGKQVWLLRPDGSRAVPAILSTVLTADGSLERMRMVEHEDLMFTISKRVREMNAMCAFRVFGPSVDVPREMRVRLSAAPGLLLDKIAKDVGSPRMHVGGENISSGHWIYDFLLVGTDACVQFYTQVVHGVTYISFTILNAGSTWVRFVADGIRALIGDLMEESFHGFSVAEDVSFTGVKKLRSWTWIIFKSVRDVSTTFIQSMIQTITRTAIECINGVHAVVIQFPVKCFETVIYLAKEVWQMIYESISSTAPLKAIKDKTTSTRPDIELFNSDHFRSGGNLFIHVPLREPKPAPMTLCNLPGKSVAEVLRLSITPSTDIERGPSLFHRKAFKEAFPDGFLGPINTDRFKNASGLFVQDFTVGSNKPSSSSSSFATIPGRPLRAILADMVKNIDFGGSIVTTESSEGGGFTQQYIKKPRAPPVQDLSMSHASIGRPALTDAGGSTGAIVSSSSMGVDFGNALQYLLSVVNAIALPPMSAFPAGIPAVEIFNCMRWKNMFGSENRVDILGCRIPAYVGIPLIILFVHDFYARWLRKNIIGCPRSDRHIWYWPELLKQYHNAFMIACGPTPADSHLFFRDELDRARVDFVMDKRRKAERAAAREGRSLSKAEKSISEAELARDCPNAIQISMPYPVPNVLVSEDPTSLEHVLKGNFYNFEKGELFREHFQEMLGDGIFNSDGQSWYDQRKIATRLFSKRVFSDYFFQIFEEGANEMVLSLLSHSEKTRTHVRGIGLPTSTIDSITSQVSPTGGPIAPGHRSAERKNFSVPTKDEITENDSHKELLHYALHPANIPYEWMSKNDFSMMTPRGTNNLPLSKVSTFKPIFHPQTSTLSSWWKSAVKVGLDFTRFQKVIYNGLSSLRFKAYIQEDGTRLLRRKSANYSNDSVGNDSKVFNGTNHGARDVSKSISKGEYHLCFDICGRVIENRTTPHPTTPRGRVIYVREEFLGSVTFEEMLETYTTSQEGKGASALSGGQNVSGGNERSTRGDNDDQGRTSVTSNGDNSNSNNTVVKINTDQLFDKAINEAMRDARLSIHDEVESMKRKLFAQAAELHHYKVSTMDLFKFGKEFLMNMRVDDYVRNAEKAIVDHNIKMLPPHIANDEVQIEGSLSDVEDVDTAAKHRKRERVEPTKENAKIESEHNALNPTFDSLPLDTSKRHLGTYSSRSLGFSKNRSEIEGSSSVDNGKDPVSKENRSQRQPGQLLSISKKDLHQMETELLEIRAAIDAVSKATNTLTSNRGNRTMTFERTSVDQRNSSARESQLQASGRSRAAHILYEIMPGSSVSLGDYATESKSYADEYRMSAVQKLASFGYKEQPESFRDGNYDDDDDQMAGLEYELGKYEVDNEGYGDDHHDGSVTPREAKSRKASTPAPPPKSIKTTPARAAKTTKPKSAGKSPGMKPKKSALAIIHHHTKNHHGFVIGHSQAAKIKSFPAQVKTKTPAYSLAGEILSHLSNAKGHDYQQAHLDGLDARLKHHQEQKIKNHEKITVRDHMLASEKRSEATTAQDPTQLQPPATVHDPTQLQHHDQTAETDLRHFCRLQGAVEGMAKYEEHKKKLSMAYHQMYAKYGIAESRGKSEVAYLQDQDVQEAIRAKVFQAPCHTLTHPKHDPLTKVLNDIAETRDPARLSAAESIQVDSGDEKESGFLASINLFGMRPSAAEATPGISGGFHIDRKVHKQQKNRKVVTPAGPHLYGVGNEAVHHDDERMAGYEMNVGQLERVSGYDSTHASTGLDMRGSAAMNARMTSGGGEATTVPCNGGPGTNGIYGSGSEYSIPREFSKIGSTEPGAPGFAFTHDPELKNVPPQKPQLLFKDAGNDGTCQSVLMQFIYRLRRSIRSGFGESNKLLKGLVFRKNQDRDSMQHLSRGLKSILKRLSSTSDAKEIQIMLHKMGNVIAFQEFVLRKLGGKPGIHRISKLDAQRFYEIAIENARKTLMDKYKRVNEINIKMLGTGNTTGSATSNATGNPGSNPTSITGAIGTYIQKPPSTMQTIYDNHLIVQQHSNSVQAALQENKRNETSIAIDRILGELSSDSDDDFQNSPEALHHRKRAAAITKCLRENLFDCSQSNEEELNLFFYFQKFTLSTIGKVGFGTDIASDIDSIRHDDPSEKCPFLSGFDELQFCLEKRIFDPFWRVKRMLNVGYEARIKHLVPVVRGYAEKICRERLEELKERVNPSDEKQVGQRADFLSLFMREMPDLTIDQYVDITINFLIAGRDTTANLLAWCIYELIENPDCLQKLREEIKAEEAGGALTYDKVDKGFPYMMKVINETLRIHPPVPKDAKVAISDDWIPFGQRFARSSYNIGTKSMEHDSPPPPSGGGCPMGLGGGLSRGSVSRAREKNPDLAYYPGCIYLPKGSWYAYPIYAVQTSKWQWGRDARRFNPDRWDELNPSQFEFPVFNAGKRICLGQKMAYIQAKICLCVLLRHIDFAPTLKQQPQHDRSVTLGMIPGLFTYVYPTTLAVKH